MGKYKLIKWYPSLPKELKEGEYVEEVYFGNPNGYYIRINPKINEGNMTFSRVEIEEHSEFWEKVIEKDYEILAFKYSRLGVFAYPQKDDRFSISKEQNLLKGHSTAEKMIGSGYKIHVVRRLSDGEIFTVGDEIIYNEVFPTKLKIKSFQIFNGELLVHKDCTMNTNKLFEIQHYKKPLLTTEDGVDIFKGDTYYFVTLNDKSHSNWKIQEGSCDWDNPKKPPLGEITFSTREKAREYVLMGKPLNISLKELCSVIVGGSTYIDLCKLAQKLKEE
jgi:hypothetical protein